MQGEQGRFDSPTLFSEEDLISLFTEVDIEVILKIIPKISSKAAKINLIEFLTNYYLTRNEIMKVSSLIASYKKASEKGNLCGKIVDRILVENSIPMTERAANAKKIIVLIGDKFYEQEEHLKVIDMLFTGKDIRGTLGYIKFLNDKDREREQYQKIIQHYSSNGDMKLAAAVIALFENNRHEKDAYTKLFQMIEGHVRNLRSSGYRYESNAHLKIAQEILKGIKCKETASILKSVLYDCIDFDYIFKEPVESMIHV